MNRSGFIEALLCPRLRTLSLAGDLRVDLLGGCEEPVSHQLNKLATDARAGGYGQQRGTKVLNSYELTLAADC
jgi:hypothetical protein